MTTALQRFFRGSRRCSRRVDRPLVVINADDFGRSSNVNAAILECFQRGLITSATMMANMPGFKDACALVHQHGLHGRIGAHLNLTQGPSISDGIRRCPRLCDARGELYRQGTHWRLSATEVEAIETELVAQIDALIANGIRPTHFDSHRHAHTQWPIATIVIRLAQRLGVSAVRLSRNCGIQSSRTKRLYKTAFNTRLERAGLARTRHFGSAPDTLTLTDFSGAVEVMVHPEVDPSGRVVDVIPGAGRFDGAESLEPVAERWRMIGSLVSYGNLRTTSN